MPTYRITGTIIEKHEVNTTIEADSLEEAIELAREATSLGELAAEADSGSSEWDGEGPDVSLDDDEDGAFEGEDDQDDDE